MKFDDSVQDGIVVLDISGKIIGGEETTMFHGKIHEYINGNQKNFIIDLAKTDWMNSVLPALKGPVTTIFRVCILNSWYL